MAHLYLKLQQVTNMKRSKPLCKYCILATRHPLLGITKGCLLRRPRSLLGFLQESWKNKSQVQMGPNSSASYTPAHSILILRPQTKDQNLSTVSPHARARVLCAASRRHKLQCLKGLYICIYRMSRFWGFQPMLVLLGGS